MPGINSDLKFLFRTARQSTPQVIRDAVLTAISGAMMNATQLLALPVWIHMVRSGASPWQVVGATAVLAAWLGLMFVFERMTGDAFARSRDAFRTRGCTMLARRATALSYAAATAADEQERLHAAVQAIGRYIDAPVVRLWQTVSNGLMHLIGLLITAAALWQINGWLAVVSAATALIGAAFHRFVTVKGAQYAADETLCDTRLSYVTHAASSESHAKEIRVFGLDTWLRDLHDRTMTAVRAFSARRATWYAFYSVIDCLLTLLRNGAGYAVAAVMAFHQPFSPSMLLVAFFAVGGFAQSVSGLFFDAVALSQDLPSLRAFRSYVRRENGVLTEGGDLPLTGPLHTLELRHVTFTYPHAETPTLRDISFTLHEGERLAIIGQNGAGKTTLARLMCGLLDPDEGAVLLDGMDIRTMDRRAVFAVFSTVFQDSALLPMTVEDFLSVDKEDESRLWDGLEQAGMAQTVRAWPKGLQTPLVDGGVGLSGGQMRRLLLARAWIKNGDIPVLDEPTAALDPLAEHELYQQYDRLTAEKSAVLISRRAVLTRFCDRILYLKNGAVSEEGTHEELMANGGDYAALYELQHRAYLEGRDPR